MKILKLEILNLASLDRQEGETINFEEGALKDATIFSIVGATGSGKSTILDAICLALYNRAPRYPRKSGDRKQGIEIYGATPEEEKNRLAPTDSRNILTRGKKEAYSKLTFRANNGNIYRAEWRVNKKQKNYGNAETYLYKISVKGNNVTEETADWSSLPLIIGLDYDQFLRTVLIAQGSFSSFIKAKENERYELLEKLIGCEDLYSRIADNIKQKKDEALREYDKIAANFSAQEKDLLKEDELEALTAHINKLETEEKKIKEELIKTIDAIGWYETDEKHIGNINKFEIALKVKKQEVEDSREEAYRLMLHDTTLEGVDIYKDMKNTEADFLKRENDLKSLGEKIARKEEEIKIAEEVQLVKLKIDAQKAEDEMRQQLPHIKKAREIKTELEGLRKALSEKKAAKEFAESTKAKADNDVETNRKAIEEYDSSLQKCKKEAVEIKDQLQKEEDLLTRAAAAAQTNYANHKKKAEGLDAALLQQGRNRAEKALEDLKSAIKLQSELRKKISRKEELINRRNNFTEDNAKIEEQLKGFDLENLSRELDTLNNTYTLITSKNLEKLRQELIEGEPCPLCGSIHHPFPKKGTVPLIDDMGQLIRQKTEALKKQREEKENLSKKHASNNGELKGIDESLKNLEVEIASHSGEWKEIQAMHEDWSSDQETLLGLQSKIEQEFKDADKRLEDYNALMKKISEFREENDKAEALKQDFVQTSTKKKQETEKKINEANTLLETEKGKRENLLAQQIEKTEILETASATYNSAKAEVMSREEKLKEEIGDKDPDALEKELADVKSNADKAVRDKIESISGLRQQLKESQGEANAVKNQQKKDVKTIENKKRELQQWINRYNQGKSEKIMEETIKHFFSATDNWEELRSKLNHLQREFTEAETTLKNEQEVHHAHQAKKPTVAKEELQIRKTELESHSNAELVDCRACLKRHEDAKKEMGTMFDKKQEAEKLKTEWEEISKAIGSEGKMLRKIAQCHTLGFLIRHANFEIRKFNSRYELQQVKNSLGIRVIDHDRADDVRDTTSLSGGETFLVSLGLALGLSSLSSRNISFENLFIDEGFGTLDPDTLDTVIDSLAMLQTSQGKKVGVISHTDSMSERIATQIRVIKNGNTGSSYIEIYPN